MPHSAFRPLTTVLVLILLGAAGCGRWQPHAVSISPDGQSRLTVWEQPLGPDSSVSLGLAQGGRERTVYRATGDRMPRLVEFAWSADGTGVGVLVCDAVNSQLLLALDLRTAETSSGEPFAGDLRAVLQRRYALTHEALRGFAGDPIQWACDERSAAFERWGNLLGPERVLPGR